MDVISHLDAIADVSLDVAFSPTGSVDAQPEPVDAPMTDVEDVWGDADAEVTEFEPECEPNVFCQDGVAGVCSAARLWLPGQDCGAEGLLCVGGTCQSPCEIEIDDTSLAGCDHWAAGLGHDTDGPFAVAALNVASVPATVAVWGLPDGVGEPTVYGSATLEPGETQAFPLPSGSVSAAGVHWGGWRLRSTAPVIAYQHNPLAGLTTDSADGALLLPVHGLGGEYMAIGRPESRAADGSRTRGTLTVVASEAGTLLTIIPSVPIEAGPDLGTLPVDQETLVGLQPYQVLHLTTAGELGDLSGTMIFASKPVGVFAGHEADQGAGDAPPGAPGDHLQDSLRPMSQWGRTHVAAKTSGRGDLVDALVIVAAKDDTLVQFDPWLHQDVLLNQGEHVTRLIWDSVVVSSSRPVQIAHVTSGSGALVDPPAGTQCVVDLQCATGYECENYACALPACDGALDDTCPSGHRCDCVKNDCRCRPVGDAAWWVVPPAGQYESTMGFLAPITYPTHHVALLLPPETASATLDGETLETEMEPVGTRGWHVATMTVSSGAHHVSADEGLGVVTYGFGRDAGYGHAGGQALRDLRGAGCEVDDDCPDPDNLCFGTAFCDTSALPPRCELTPDSAKTCGSSGNPCVFAVCDPNTGSCTEATAPDGVPCPSQVAPCAVGVCSAGVCVDGVVPCDDGLYCNGQEVCDLATYTCQPGPDPVVDDGIPCTLDSCDEALNAVVHTPQPGMCDDGFVCNGEEVCDVELGCVHQALSICDDGVFCNGLEDCDDVTCIPGTPPEVDDGIPCTLDACDETIGAVVNLPDHSACADTLLCTLDTCVPGVGCTHVADPCDDANACTLDTCDDATGCANEAVDCDDGDACTEDTCSPTLGCQYTPIICDDADPCTPNFCIPASGCIFGAPCDDGDVCTVDGCDGEGECTVEDLDCEDDNPCTTDFCDATVGCLNINLCDDENLCTTDGCEGSVCTHVALDCDDGDPCTTDSCDPQSGCANVAQDCSDEDPCTTDTCDGQGNCLNPPLDCDDDNACTEDECHESGTCTHTQMSCDDGVPCTTDICHSDSGCENLSPCDDGLVCTVDICLEGGGCEWSILDCDDDDPCTEDSCDPLGGCFHVDTCGGE